MRGKLKRKFAVVMASVLALSNIQTAPVFAAVEEERTIIRFEELPEKYAVQELELGAAKEDIRFPGSLWAEMVIVKQKNEESKTEKTEAGKTEEGKSETEPSVEAEESSGADITTEQQAGDADPSVSAEKEKALPEDGERAPSDESSDEGTVNEPETTDSDTTGTVGAEEEEKPEIKQPESDAEEDDSPDTGVESEKPAKEENDAGKPSGNQPDDSGNSEEQKAPVATGSEAEEPEKGHDSDDKVEKTVRRKIRDIEWELNFTESSDAKFQSEIPGTYVYEPVIPSGYEIGLEVELPQILVKVGAVDAEEKPCTKTEGCTLPDGHEGECVPGVPTEDNTLLKTIIDWTWIDPDGNLNEGELALPGVNADNQVDFDTVVKMLPTAISAKIKGETDQATVEITGWMCETFTQTADGNWPLTGDYTFTAALPEGYACDPLPEVKVLLGGGNLYADEYDGLTITGGAVTQETDGQIKLTENNGNYTIAGNWNGTLTDATSDNKKAVITVSDGVTANVRLDGISINVSSTNYAGAFAVAENGTANIILSGTNELASGRHCAGLEVPENAAVMIDGAAILTANGGSYGAGIGGGSGNSGGTIEISGGTVIAKGGVPTDGTGGSGTGIGGGGGTGSNGIMNEPGGGAGIGGGGGGSGGTITISGGAWVTASGGHGGNADSFFDGGDGGTISISGQGTTVTATGNDDVGDIGNGHKSNGGSLSVTDGAKLEMTNTGTNITDPEYRNCSITDKDGITVHYDNKGKEVKITEEGGIKIIAGEGGEVDYTDGSGFTLSRNGAYTISGDWSGSLNANQSTPKAVITVPDTVTADVTLNSVNIDMTVPYYACAFAVEGNGTANITLSGSNLLTSASARAGLEVPENAECTITGGSSDTLTATGGYYSAGIGGGYRHSGGTITISGGTVTANGGAGSSGGGGGAGIGGGMSGDGGTIEISGGTVNATGRDNGAGIGGGGGIVSDDGGGGGKINITGGVVTATGDANGAGIGGGGTEDGSGGSAGTIVINGNTVIFAATGNNGVPIGSGGNWTNNGEKAGILTGGVIFEGTEGTVYGSSSLPEDLKISNGSTLTVPDGSILTIPDNTILTNNGTLDNYGTIDGNGSITNNGTINDHSGGISANVTGTGVNNKPSEITVTFQNSKGETITEAVSGDTITITATAQTKTTSASYRSAAKEKVDFYIGTIAEDHKIGTADVVADSSTAAATLTIPLSGDTWGKGFVIGSNPITADFGGAAAVSLLDSTGTAVLKVKSVPTLSLTADPPDAVDLPNNVILKATLLNASPGNQGKTITFTAANGTYTAITDSSGVAACTITNLTQGTYTFGASFAGDTDNSPAVAADINGYSVGLGTQAELTLNGLSSAYTYGCDSFSLSTSGGSGSGAVSYTSSDSSVASVTGNTVTIQKAGKFTITAAKAADSSFKEASVTSSEVTVSPATPDISMTATGGSNINDPIILTVTVAKAGTGMIPIGTVTFSEGGAVLAADVSLNGSGEASFTVSNLTAGNHTYTAVYSGQTGYYIGRSVTRNLGVGLADQTGFVITAPSAKTYGDSDFTLTASGGQSTGGVSFSVPFGNGVLTVSADGAVKITGAGSVKVTATKAGDNSYNEATATQDITVAPRDISNVTVTITGSRVYTGSQLQPVFEVKDGSIAITTGDFTNSYGDNLDAGTGLGSITLAGQHNYTGTATVRFDIEQRSLTGAVIILASEAYDYTGSEIRPAVTSVTVDGIMVPDSEFDVDYHDNIAAGTAVVTVRAKTSGNFRGEANATFTITKSSGGHSSGSNGSSSDNSAVSNPSVLNGHWQQSETGEWKFLLSAGGYAANSWGIIDGRWYYFDHDGRMLTDWQQLNGVWYYLATSEDAKRTEGMKEGEMRTGWIYDLFYQKWFYLDKDGAMATGWREIDGKWYYFNPAPDGMRGAMVTDAWVDDWYLNQDGIGINQTRR